MVLEAKRQHEMIFGRLFGLKTIKYPNIDVSLGYHETRNVWVLLLEAKLQKLCYNRQI